MGMEYERSNNLSLAHHVSASYILSAQQLLFGFVSVVANNRFLHWCA